ncbi:hypothetical protein A7K91_16345 [Paenibacillus oryzae]|uniref:Uncharacterized protein n=1 Tax=Paenibacillus oryzae TaxID=1844972 RepID=A0A1A5YMF9_9BACL|nr:hypothetical protein [Paenibacillus oryzae]OBR66806.1 hypothetical protein A7K91_16345 [Paenibacillus oryzae]
MVNKRSFLIGLGLGIIIGALLLELFYMGEASQRGLEGIGRELEQGAQKPEATAAPSADPTANLASPSGSVAATPKPSSQREQKDEEASEETAKAPTQSPESGTGLLETAPPPAASQNAGDKPADSVVVRIEHGSSLTEAAELLAAAGVLDSAESFAKEMKSRNKLVRAGYFLFPPGASTLDEVINIITGIPLPPKEAAKLDSLLWRG